MGVCPDSPVRALCAGLGLAHRAVQDAVDAGDSMHEVVMLLRRDGLYELVGKRDADDDSL